MTLPALWGRLKEGTRLATAGGNWVRAVSLNIQYNLRWFFFDGILSAGQDGIVLTYLSLYLLALGATSGQIGLMAALTSLGATLMLLPGAILAERFGKRKLIVLLSGGGTTRIMILLMALTPFILHGQAAIFFVIGLKVIADGSTNMGLPAWTSLAGDIVPLAWRGRYFGSKNLYMAVSGIATTLLLGNLITQNGSVTGYQIALGVAFLIGCTATFSYSHIREPVSSTDAAKPAAYTLSSLVQTLKDDRNFLYYASFGMVWNLAIGVAGPFFGVYIIEGLKGNANDVGLFSIAGSLAGLPAIRFFGRLSDRWGPRKVMLVTGCLIPFIPLVWVFARLPVHGILFNIPAGLVWAGFNLAAFNFLLSLAPPMKRARYTALYQIAVALSSAAGAAIGGLVVTHFGYIPIFVISGIGRFLGIFLFARFVHQKAEG
jgi:MFS family permease